MKEGRWLEDMIGGFEPRLPSGTFPEGIQCSELMAAVLKAARSCAGLSHFFNRSLQPGRTDLAPGRLRSDVWPCPPPRWGRWTQPSSLSPRRRRRVRFLEVRALCLQHLIISLNWLALGCCRSPPDHARVGYPMTAAQHETVERLEDLVDYFLKADRVTAESLGRAGEKLSRLSALSFSLRDASRSFDFDDISSFLTTIQKSFDSYSKPSCSHHRPTKHNTESEQSELASSQARPLEPRVKVSSSACTAKPVIAERIKWKLAPSFDPRPYLTDEVVLKAFEDPDVLRRPEHTWPKLPRAKVHASRNEVLSLARKWDELGACRLVCCNQVKTIETVGIFAVPKDETYDRLILNPAVVNSRSYPYARFTKTIAPGYLISMIQLADNEHLLCSSDDLCEFYYTFKVSSKRAQRNAIGVPFKASELSHLSCFDAQQHTGDLYICLGTLAMGDALAVEIAQQSHINLLRTRAGCMQPNECLQYRHAIPRGPFYELLTIDDHIGLQKVIPALKDTPQFSRDVEVFSAANRAYTDVGLRAHPGKRQRRETRVTVLGAEVDGVRGRVSAPRGRIVTLCFITAVLVKKGMATRKLLQGLIGCWTHICLFRRPSFAILDKVYNEGSALPEDTVFKMSKQCKLELTLLSLIAPAIQTDMRTAAAPYLFMMDASPFGGAICRAAMPTVAVEELWRHSEQRGFYTKLQQGPGMVLRELGLEHEECFGSPSSDRVSTPAPLPAKFSRLLRDRTIVFDCIELFAGFGNWSKSHAANGLRVHPGIERSATGRGYGDLLDDDTFRELAKLAYSGSIKEWHAGPPCWSFGTLRRPRLRSKEFPAGFVINEPKTQEQTRLAVRTALLLFLAISSGCFISVEQPGSSVMFCLDIFARLLQAGCQITKFCFCSYGSAFQKPSKWLHNKPWYTGLGGRCTCPYKNNHFTVQGSFTRATISLFNSRCRPSSFKVYGKEPKVGEAMSSFSAGYPLPLCQAMAAGSLLAHRAAAEGETQSLRRELEETAENSCLEWERPWFDDPEWVEDICESQHFKELFRYHFKQTGHINVLECRVYKSFLKHAAKAHARQRLVTLLDSRVTMGAVAKGRSSSKALSRVLRTSLCYVLGGSLYPGSLHCRSKWNRADGPSRDREVEGPTRNEPPWLTQLKVGNFVLFDQMVSSAAWIRPIGRWIRLLLLLAGDVEENPGPVRVGAGAPRGDLNLLGGFARTTSDRMAKCLRAFEDWCGQTVNLSLAQVLENVETANLALKAYGMHLFKQGSPRYLLVYAITSVQQLRPEFRRQLCGAWQVDKRWQMEEPGQCRAVLSAPVLRAILALALMWDWYAFAGIVSLGFGCMLHPNEFLNLIRKDLVFPEDTLMEQHMIYVFIRNPKTARFARRQHSRLDDPSLQFLVRCVFRHLSLEDRLFPASVAAFRRQWNSLLDRLGVPRRQSEGGATPGTLRGSGATHEYLQSADIVSIQWKGRWSQIKTLEHYIQEVGAQLFLFNLSATARQRTQFLSDHLPVALQHHFPKEFSRFCNAEQ